MESHLFRFLEILKITPENFLKLIFLHSESESESDTSGCVSVKTMGSDIGKTHGHHKQFILFFLCPFFFMFTAILTFEFKAHTVFSLNTFAYKLLI